MSVVRNPLSNPSPWQGEGGCHADRPCDSFARAWAGWGGGKP